MSVSGPTFSVTQRVRVLFGGKVWPLLEHENRLTPFHVQKNLASFPFWNFACSKGLRRRSTKAGIFRKECNKSCQLIQSGKGVCVLNSISGGEETFSSPPSTLLWKSRYFFGTSKETFKIDGVCMMGLQIWKVGKEGTRVMNICLWSSTVISIYLAFDVSAFSNTEIKGLRFVHSFCWKNLSFEFIYSKLF